MLNRTQPAMLNYDIGVPRVDSILEIEESGHLPRRSKEASVVAAETASSEPKLIEKSQWLQVVTRSTNRPSALFASNVSRRMDRRKAIPPKSCS